VLGSVACSELGLPTPKKADGFAETQAEPGATGVIMAKGKALFRGW
jgi:hypothetical protein